MPGRDSRLISTLFLLAPLLLTPGAMPAQQSNDDNAKFQAFFAEFQQAVAQKDHAKLEHLMMPSFDYFQAQHVAHATVFHHLDAKGGTQWINLQQSVQGNPNVVVQEYKHRPARLLQCRATSDLYHCVLAFQQDNMRQWRWKAMAMTHRH